MATQITNFVKLHALLEFVSSQQDLVMDLDWVRNNNQENLLLSARLLGYVRKVAEDNPEFNVTSSSVAGQEIVKQMIEIAFNEVKSILDAEGF